jgi:hypothetical protein
MNTSRENIINEIKRTARENRGKPLGRQKLSQVTGISMSDWYGKLWARWGDAVKEAGFEPNDLQEAYPEKELLEKLCAYTEELGKFPTDAELRLKTNNDKDFPQP